MKILLLILMMACGVSSMNLSQPVAQNNEGIVLKLQQNSSEIDEFLSYWFNDFRKTPTCDVTYEKFREMYDKYLLLSPETKAVVDKTKDVEENYTIKQVIDTLVNKFYSQNKNNSDDKQVLDQTTTLIIVTVTAIFGMSMILVFYILKKKEIIK